MNSRYLISQNCYLFFFKIVFHVSYFICLHCNYCSVFKVTNLMHFFEEKIQRVDGISSMIMNDSCLMKPCQDYGMILCVTCRDSRMKHGCVMEGNSEVADLGHHVTNPIILDSNSFCSKIAAFSLSEFTYDSRNSGLCILPRRNICLAAHTSHGHIPVCTVLKQKRKKVKFQGSR